MAKEDHSPNEIGLSPAGHQPSISWSWGNLLLLLLLSLLLLLLLLQKAIYLVGLYF